MILKCIKARNFKNYSEVRITPSPNCNVIFGDNGSGKTNLLDMIHFSALSKSYFPISDKMAIRAEEEFTRVEADYEDSDRAKIVKMVISIPRTGRKKIWIDGDIIKRSTDILGVVPIVAIVPDDIEIVKSSSEVRRKFMDRILCQLSPEYTTALVSYQRVLKQKTAYLKSISSLIELDKNLVNSYDSILLRDAIVIGNMRKDFVDSFLTIFLDIYHRIDEYREEIDIHYNSNFNQESFLQDCANALEKDYYSKRISTGIHRDDLLFTLSDHTIRRYGSQGQIKTFVYALKLSEYLYLNREGDAQPILLLDDVFEKLDVGRLSRLLWLINSDQFGQIFITDTELERSKLLLDELNVPFSCFQVINQKITTFHG